MLFDEKHIFINGESFRVGGKDARCLRQLADERQLSARQLGQLSDAATEALEDQWREKLFGTQGELNSVYRNRPEVR